MTIRFRKQSAVSVAIPATDYVAFFVDSATGLARLKDDSGTVTDLGSGGSSGGEGGESGTPETVSSIATSNVTAALHSVQRVNVASSAVTVSLPTGHSAGDRVTVKLVSAATNACTIDPGGSETIDGDATLVLSTAFEWATLISDGTNWLQIA